MSSDHSVPLSLTHLPTNSLSRHIHREEAEEVDRVKRDVNVNTVEKDIRYLLNTSYRLQLKTKLILPSSVFHLNDSHLHLMVHWAGQGSSIVFCLARDQVYTTRDIEHTTLFGDFRK